MNANQPMLLPHSIAKPDIVRRFLAWAQSADLEARAHGASALARAYLYSDLTAPMRAEAALAMTALLDDPSALVRQALAAALCTASDAPRILILGLAADEPEVAAAVLQRSPVLTDADLVDCARTGDVVAQAALARRPNLPPDAAAALAEIGQVLALIANLEIDLPAELLGGIMTRFNDDASVREALLERPSLPASVRARIAVAAAKDLAIEAAAWMAHEQAERIARDARDQALCTIASSCSPDERAELTRALRAAGSLTPALLLRSLLGGEWALFADALAELSALPLPRVAAFILEPQGEGFAALALRAGLKSGVLAAFRARSPRSRFMRARLAAGSNCPLCKRSTTNANGAKILRSARFGRCCGASPPRRRGPKPRASRARRLPPRRAVGCRGSWTFRPSTTTPARRRSCSRTLAGLRQARRRSSSRRRP